MRSFIAKVVLFNTYVLVQVSDISNVYGNHPVHLMVNVRIVVISCIMVLCDRLTLTVL